MIKKIFSVGFLILAITSFSQNVFKLNPVKGKIYKSTFEMDMVMKMDMSGEKLTIPSMTKMFCEMKFLKENEQHEIEMEMILRRVTLDANDPKTNEPIIYDSEKKSTSEETKKMEEQFKDIVGKKSIVRFSPSGKILNEEKEVQQAMQLAVQEMPTGELIVGKKWEETKVSKTAGMDIEMQTFFEITKIEKGTITIQEETKSKVLDKDKPSLQTILVDQNTGLVKSSKGNASMNLGIMNMDVKMNYELNF